MFTIVMRACIPQNARTINVVGELARPRRWTDDQAVADIEQDAFKRDRRFLFRLVIVMVIAVAAGIFLFMNLTSDGAKGCATEAVGGVAEEPRSE
jgi:hypothetical protein